MWRAPVQVKLQVSLQHSMYIGLSSGFEPGGYSIDSNSDWFTDSADVVVTAGAKYLRVLTY